MTKGFIMKYICPKCGEEIQIKEPCHQVGFGWFAGAYCQRCNYIFAEVRNAPSKKKAEELLKQKILQ